MTSNIPIVTIIIPAYNEEEGIKRTIERLQAYSKNNLSEWIIIVVNDGSTDDTQSIVEEIKGVNLINHPYNKGYGASLKTGIKEAKTDLIAFYDADGQHNPEDLEELLKNFENNDMLIGKRGKDSHQEWIRKPGKWILSKVANFLTSRKIPDLNSGLRVVKRSIILQLLHLFPDGFSFSTTSTIAFLNLGYNVGYYPIKVNKRVGKSSVKQLKHGSNTLLLILRLIVLFNPLRVFIPASFLLVFIGIIYEIIYGIILMQGIKLLPGSILIILSGILIFFFGLVVDQISEMRKHIYLK
ncbi:MAG: glycosyltransferase family 2 protein [Bacteroidales bacterium]|nr:glycosyltransferase family 2 protein [Bacteroidales bacterium]